MGTFQEGYEFFSKGTGAMGASIKGSEYVHSVEAEISKMVEALSQELGGKHTEIDKAKGFAAEQWHAGTYNVDAALKGSSNRVQVASDIRGELGSPDIVGDAGKAGLKYYKTGAKSAQEQAQSLFERYKKYEAQVKARGGSPISFEEYQEKKPFMAANDPLYGGQARIIPKEQLEQATTYLKEKIAKEELTRPEQVKRYKDTLELLQDRLKDSNGNESVPLSTHDAEKIARLAKEGKFDPKEFGISTENLMRAEYIKTQAMQAGLSAAAITVALRTAPEIVKGIRHLAETGEIDLEQLKKTGFVALSSGAEGFLKGSLSAAVTISCKSGIWGEALKGVSPTAVGGIIVFAFDAIKGGIEVILDKKDDQQFKQELAEEAFSATGAALVGGTLNAAIPGIGYLVGSLIGSMLGSYTYHIATKTTATDQAVSFFKQQAQALEKYAAKLLNISLEEFHKLTELYESVADSILTAKDNHELNRALKNAHKTLGIDLPWQGDFDAFMSDKSAHLVFQ